ncbi:unnamed protein product [Laminaria digitata]
MCLCPRANSISAADLGTLEGGREADDVCECNTDLYDAGLGVCGCNMTNQCRGDRCCMADNLCSDDPEGTVDTGDMADDVCECASGVFNSGMSTCGCNGDSDCSGNRCCMANNMCSSEEAGSVRGGLPADDVCECNTGRYDADDGVCGCNMTAECTGRLCCTDGRRCSVNDWESLEVGDMATDVCECDSGVLSDDGDVCACDNDGDCPGDTCCMADSQCSSHDEDSRLGGLTADDVCECTTGRFDDGVCGESPL